MIIGAEFVDAAVARRTAALKLTTPCGHCASKQVQLKNWLDEAAEFKCRECGHKWSTAFTKDAHA